MLTDWGIAIGIAVLLLVGMSVLDWMKRPSGDAPGLHLVRVSGGHVELAELQGQVVVVNFWGTWCPPCVREIPELAEFSAAYPDVRVLGVAVNSGTGGRLATDAERLGITYDVLEATDQVVREWGVDVFPTTYVIDRNGQIVASKTGALVLEDLIAMVEKAG